MQKLLFRSACVVVCCPMAPFAMAQVAADSHGGATTQSAAIEEVVVTAQRREENLQNVPIAVTAISGERLEQFRVQDNYGLVALTPALTINRSAGYAQTFLRGVGTPSIIAGDEPSVATYVDGFYQGPSLASVLMYNNIHQIEILKGPQGTLYGRNATGGLINLITATPRDHFFADGSVGYGRYDTLVTDAYVTGPIDDKVKVDLAVRYVNQGEGVVRNLTTGRRVGKDDGLSLRSKLVFEVSDRTRLTLGADYADLNHSIGDALSPLPGTTPIAALVGGQFSATPYVINNNVDPKFSVKVFGATAKLQSDIGSATFVSMSQFRHYTSSNALDVDDTSADNVFSVVHPTLGRFALPTLNFAATPKMPYFGTQEFQLLSNGGGPFSWIAGAFGLDSREGLYPFISAVNKSLTPIASITAFSSTKAYAGYAQATYAFHDGLSLTAGGRYSYEQKHTIGQQVAGGTTIRDDKEKSWDSFTYRFSADYKWTPQLLTYASTSKGFKSGTFNTTSIDNAPAVNPETLYAHEIGFKSDPYEYLRINGSSYYYDYKDIQVYSQTAGGIGSLQNAAAATLYGLELDVEAVPISRLTLQVGIGLEHSRYDNFDGAQIYVNAPVAGERQVFANVTGNRTVQTPTATGNFSANYDLKLPGHNGDLIIAGNLYYNGGYAFDPAGVVKQGRYTVVDASVTWNLPGDHWTAMVWAKNLNDELYLNQETANSRVVRVGYALPRTFGLKFSYRTE
jgi:iron complex outermembrane receptor protein